MIDSGNTAANLELDNAVDWLIPERKNLIVQWIGWPCGQKKRTPRKFANLSTFLKALA